MDQGPLGQVSVQTALSREAGLCNMSMSLWTDSFNEGFCWRLIPRGRSKTEQDLQRNLQLTSKYWNEPEGEQSPWILPQRREQVMLDLHINENA